MISLRFILIRVLSSVSVIPCMQGGRPLPGRYFIARRARDEAIEGFLFTTEPGKVGFELDKAPGSKSAQVCTVDRQLQGQPLEYHEKP